MPLGMDVGRVDVKDVEDEVGLVFVDACVAGHMVGYRRIGAHAFLQFR
jgi:hypothetical protein